jgi:hypothetical protein
MATTWEVSLECGMTLVVRVVFVAALFPVLVAKSQEKVCLSATEAN